MAQLPLNLSGIAGLSQYQSQNTRNAYRAKEGEILQGVFNPFIRYGYMSPPNNSTTSVTLDQTQGAPMTATLYDPIEDDFYFAEANTQMFKGDSTTDTTLTRVLNLSSTRTITDLGSYMINTARRMFVLYRNNSDQADIAVSTFPYDSATDNVNYLTSTVNGAFTNGLTGDFFMHESDNSFAYLYMENQVHRLDGTSTGGANGTVYSNELLFPVGFRMVDVLEEAGLQYIAFHGFNTDLRSNNPVFQPLGPSLCGIYVWDRQTTVVGARDFIPLPGIRVIHKLYKSPSGFIRLICTDINGYTQIYQYTGNGIEPIFRVNFNAFPVYRDSVAVYANGVLWNGRDGNQYFHGSIVPGEPEGLYVLKSFSVASTHAGVVLPAATSTSSSAPAFYTTTQLTGPTLANYRIEMPTLVSQTSGLTAGTGSVLFPVQFMPVYSKTAYIKIPCIPTTSSGSTTIATINVYLNMQNTVFNAKTVTQLEANTGMIDIPCAKDGVWAIQLEVVWEANSLGSNDFCFASGYVEYEPMAKRK